MDRQPQAKDTEQAGQQLGVDGRTVRLSITEGLSSAGRVIVHLEARQVRINRGPAEQSQALTLSVQVSAAELERRGAALQEAQGTIERLAREAGHHAGRAEQLEQERDALQEKVAALEAQRAEWQKRANQLARRRPHAIRLQPWQGSEMTPRSSETSTAMTQPIARQVGQTTMPDESPEGITSPNGQHAITDGISTRCVPAGQHHNHRTRHNE